MKLLSAFNFRNSGLAAGLAVALISCPVAQPTAAAGGLLSFMTGMSVTEGCTSFIGPYGHAVPVRHYLPNTACAGPAVILLHGSDGGTRHGADYEEVGRGLAAQGFATFCVSYYEGMPTAPRPGPNDRALPDPMAFIPWTATVEQAVSYVQAFPGVDPARLGILGMSLGGFVGSSVSVNDPRVKALVVLSGGMPDLYAQQMRTMPRTLIVHGDQDTDVPIAAASNLHNLMANRGLQSEFLILPCEGHLPYQTFKSTVAKKVLSFFNSAL